LTHPAHSLQHRSALQCHAEEERQTGEGGVDGGTGNTLFDQVQLECAQIFGRSQVGGTAEKTG